MQHLESKQYYPMSDYRTLNEMLDRTFRTHREQTAIVYRIRPTDEAQYITYEQMQDDYLSVQQGLADLQAGERRIAVTGENSYFWMLSYLATVTGLGTVIPLDSLLQEEEMVGLLNRSEADTLVCDAAIYLKLQSSQAWSELTHLRRVIVMLPERLNQTQREELEHLLAADADDLATFATILERGRDMRRSGKAGTFPEPDPEASRILIFTSGTTAQSKGVLLSHQSIVANLRALEGMIELEQGLRVLSVLPLNHVFEGTIGFLHALNIGAQTS